MNEATNWLDDNNRFLAKNVARLRALLEARAGHRNASFTSTETPPAFLLARAVPERGANRTGAVAKAAPPADAEPEGSEASPDGDAAKEAQQTPPALLILAQRLGLSPFEQEVLLLCAAVELDTGIGALCGRALGDMNRAYPTFALALSLFDDPAWDALSPERPLRFWRLIEINQPGAQPLTTSALRIDERIMTYLKGLDYLDDRLANLLSPIELADAGLGLPPSQRSVVDSVVACLRLQATDRPLPTVQLVGPDGPSKHRVAASISSVFGARAYRLAVEDAPSAPGEVETLARLWRRESLLLPVTLYLDAHEVEGEHGQAVQAISRLLERGGGLVFLGVRHVWSMFGKANVTVDVEKPNAVEQTQAWTRALGARGADAPRRLGSQFNMETASIERIAARALAANDSPGGPSLNDRLWSACLDECRPRIDDLAQRVEARAHWEDIVLPEAEADLLWQIADQVKSRAVVHEDWGFGDRTNRGLGMSVLFCGESGTGKTMAAEVLANHLRLDLYRIDLSAVVNKYIGETEKKLRRVFDACEDGGAILFFDECDALFGRRSEVKDSHDRYANIEINYLLQRMETYRGLAILATNMKSALDTAFLRRLRFIVNFSYPSAAERKAIWRKVFPAKTPLGDLDFDRLARLNLTGGNISNVALNAAFLAVRSGGPVTMPLVLAAARMEFRKLDRPINEADFRWTDAAGAVA